MVFRRLASSLTGLLVFFASTCAARADEPTPILPDTATTDDARVAPAPQPPAMSVGPARQERRRRRDPGLFAGGLATAIAGGVAINVGAAMVVVASDPCLMMCVDHVRHTDTTLQTAGVAVLASGVILVAVGVPLAIAGGRKVPIASTDARVAPFAITF
jgi:hypothetical protein